ncbi:MAG: hypothetical protein ACJA0I_000537 [Gammaproteobacteria bacterium]|jgi:hypothetical protein
MKLMSKRWLINYVLIVLIILFTYIGNRSGVEPGYNPQSRITLLKLQDIDRVSIQTADDTINLTRTNGQWQIVSPIQWLANNITIERIIGIASSETDSKLPANEIDLSTIGLQFPKAILSLNDTRINFGATNQIGERRYLLVNSTVFLLPDRHLPFITRGISGLIDQRLLPRALALSRLKIGPLEITQTENGGWQDSNNTSSPDQLNTIIGNWQTLQASRIQAFKKKSTPIQKITASFDNGNQVGFFLMSIKPEIIIAHPDIGLQYHFNKDQYYNLLEVNKNVVPKN